MKKIKGKLKWTYLYKRRKKAKEDWRISWIRERKREGERERERESEGKRDICE